MDIDLVLTILGLLLAVFFGVLGVRAGIRWFKQRQVVKSGSTAIQSGRDTRIGKGE